MRVDVGQALRVFTKYNADFSPHNTLDSIKAGAVAESSGALPASKKRTLKNCGISDISAVIETHYGHQINNLSYTMQTLQDYLKRVQDIDNGK